MSATVIETDLVVQGNMTAADGVVTVKGKVAGDITARSVDVAAGGNVEGAVTADNVSIEGNQSGSVKCTELTLGATSEVNSQVTAKTMVSEKGSKLVGEVRISGG